ncbi:hypothetical protein EMCRGX_G013943 [Ephydatia muelleri]
MRRDDLCTDFMRHVNDVFAGSIKVKCGQTGKVFVTKIHNLSKEDQAESLTIEDLKMGPSTISKVKKHDSGDQSKRAVLLHAIEGSASTLEATSYFKSPKQMSPSVSDPSCEVKQCCHFFNIQFSSSESQNSNAAQLTLLRSINGTMSQICLEHITAGPDQVKPV